VGGITGGSLVLGSAFRKFCLHALELEEAGERDIYKISLLEASFWSKKLGQPLHKTPFPIAGIILKFNKI